MSDAILVINAGSSSIKFALFAKIDAALTSVARGQIEGIFTTPRFSAKDADGRTGADRRWDTATALGGHEGALDFVLDWLDKNYTRDHPLSAIGHRVVHGGTKFAAPVRIDAGVVDQLEKLVPLAPLHQPHNLAPIRMLLKRLPALPQVACFDTAAHRSNPPIAQMYGLPMSYYEDGVRRYGFHGLSYEYIASTLPQFDARAAEGKTIVLHLGNGASMCALQSGKSVASTMGFTALDGLPMGTRCGSIDPGVLLYLLGERGMDAASLQKLLYNESGLLGISGVSSDMRELLASDLEAARVAVELFVYRIGRELGSLAAAMQGVDAIVFTAGIGEHAAAIRAGVCRDAGWLGVTLDAAANETHGPRISTASSATSAWVIPTDEERMIARHTRALLAS